ncbi:MAG TPA: fibronectin type III domain-containing protein [Vicinamibacterales bacterium]|jgi:hypothetical protein
MQQKGLLWIGAVALVALAVACGGSEQKPVSPTIPSASTASGTAASADGSTLKVNAPALTSPIGGIRLTVPQPTLAFQAAAGKYVSGMALRYRVELQNAAGTVVETQTGSALSYTVKLGLDVDVIYKWRVRAELEGAYGPWSATETFRSMQIPTGYLKGNELYDPLNNGKTIGKIIGSSTWIPGVGLRLDSDESYVEYQLPQTCSECEYSALISGLSVVSRTEDPKNRVMTMREGTYGINDNPYRMSLDKRGNGAIAWRFISGNNAAGQYIETTSSQRIPYPFHEDLTYLWKATWTGGTFRVQVLEGGANGQSMYDVSRSYKGIYQPSPHMIYAGSPFSSGDRGDPSTVVGMIIRQIWVSPNPRPAWANQ